MAQDVDSLVDNNDDNDADDASKNMTKQEMMKVMLAMKQQHKSLMTKLDKLGQNQDAPLDLTANKEAFACPQPKAVVISRLTFAEANKRHKENIKAPSSLAQDVSFSSKKKVCSFFSGKGKRKKKQR